MSQKKSPQKKQYTQEEYLRRRAQLKYSIIALIVLAAAVIAFFLWQSARVVTGSIDGTYYCQLNDSSPYIFYLEFDNKTGTYSSRVGDEASGSGTYRVSGDTLTTKASNVKTAYDIHGDYLLDKDHYYEGILPDGNTFDATIAQATDSYTITLTFSADGTYTSSILSEGEEEPTVTTGTYQRDGDLLRRYRQEENGTQTATPNLLVLDGKVNSYYYLKAPADEADSADSSVE